MEFRNAGDSFRIVAQLSSVVGKDDEIQKAVNNTVFFTKKVMEFRNAGDSFRIVAQLSSVVGKDDEIQKAVNNTVFFTKKVKGNFCLYQIFLLDGCYGVLEGKRFIEALLQIQEYKIYFA